MTYPNVLKRTIALFEKSMYQILNTDEADKVAKSAGFREWRTIKMLKNFATGKEPGDMHIWAMLPVLTRCPNLMAVIIAFMVTNDDTAMTEEDLEAFFGKR